jgi:hypothetical protein
MEIEENENFENLDKWIKESIRDDFMSYIDKGGFEFKKDLTEIAKQFKHTTQCIKKLTTLVSVEREKSQYLEEALRFQSKQIESICREIIMLKGD